MNVIFQKTPTCFAVTGLVIGMLFNLPYVRANGWEHTAIPLTALLSSLSDTDSGNRANAVYSLGFRHEEKVADRLRQLLRSGEPEPKVRQLAYQSLGRIGVAGSIEPNLQLLQQCITEEPDKLVVVACTTALGSFPDARAESTLAGLVDSEWGRAIRRAAVVGLGSYDSELSRSVLGKVIKQQTKIADKGLLLDAIASMGTSGNPLAAVELLDVLESIDPDDAGTYPVLVQILKALTETADRRAESAVSAIYNNTTNPRIRRHALIAIGATKSADGANVGIG